jgi:hypothetical protein
MASFVKFYSFVENVAEKKFDLGADTLKIALTNSAPSQSNTQLSDITQIANGNGYTTGGTAVTITSSAQTTGVYKLVLADVVFTASGGSIGPFRYAVLYDDTSTNDLLIGYYDYGSSLTLADTETFTLDYDPSNGALSIT